MDREWTDEVAEKSARMSTVWTMMWVNFVKLVNLVMQIFKWTKWTKWTEQIFVESAESAKSAKSIFATFATFASANFVGKASNESTVRYREWSRIPSTCLRFASIMPLTCLRYLFRKVLILSMLLFTLGVGNVWGVEEVVYTLEPANGTNNSYTGNCDVTIDGITWNVSGNSQMQPWRIGGKNTSNTDRVIYSKNPIPENVTKIIITHGAKSSGCTVNSMTVLVSTAQNGGGTQISKLTPTYVDKGTVTIERPAGKDWTGRYYKITYNYKSSSGSSNNYLQFAEAEFYAEGTASCSASPTVGNAANNGALVYSTSPMTVPVTCPSIGAGSSCEIKDYGFVWKAGGNPTIANNKTQIGTNNHSTAFSGNISGTFAAGTTYYVKAYAINNGDNTTLSTSTYTFTPRSITFNSNGGSAVATILVLSGTAASEPTAPTNDGYTFGGWYTDSGLGTPVNWSSNITSNKTYYAKWTPDASCDAPAAPGNSSVSSTGATITFSESGNYDIYYSTSATAPTGATAATTTVSSASSKDLTGLAVGTTYYYWARKDCGGSKSDYVAGSPTNFTTTVPAPTGLSMTPSLNGVTFGITDANDVNNYEIYYSTTNSAPGASPSGTATTTTKSKEVTGLPASTTYYCWVRAKGPNENSSWYSAGSFATLTLSSISVSTAPTKTKYLVGDNFDPTGLVITRTYSNSTSDTYSYAGHTSEFSFSPATNTALTVDDDAVTITYGGQTVDQSINVYTVTVNKVNMSGTAITNASVTATCSGRTLSQSVGSTNYKFNSWNVMTGGVSLSGSNITGTPTGNVTINAKFHDPITVTWKVGSGAASGGTSEVKYGTAITALPSTPADNALASCGTNKFMGWSTEEITTTGIDEAPDDLFTAASGASELTENTTYRAVFANGSGSGSEGYNKVTSTGNITNDGRYLIVYESGNVAFNGNLTTLDASSNVVTATVSTSAIAVNDDNRTTLANAEFSIDMTNKYIKSHSNKYINYNSYGNSLTASDDATAVHSISIDGSGNLVIEGTGQNSSSPYDYVVLRFNSSTGSGGWRFRFYKGTQQAIQLYKYDPGTTYSDYQTGCCSDPGTALSITSANSVATGGTVSLTSTGGNGGAVTWSVVNGTGTASVAGTTLTAGSVGTVTVKAHQDATGSYCAQDAEQAFTVVSSTVNVTGVTVAPTTKAIIPGETFTITPTISPSNATDKSVSWTSSASDKATVSSGTVTGVAAGTATITCTTTDGSKTATTAVTVHGFTVLAQDEDGTDISGVSGITASHTGKALSAGVGSTKYVFKTWKYATGGQGGLDAIPSATSTSTTLTGTPTGDVTVIAEFYKPCVIKWSVNGNDSYATGEPTTTVAYNGTISAVPTAPADNTLSCTNKFMGWSAKNGGSDAKTTSYYDDLFTDVEGSPAITGNTTFYAVFAERSNSDGYKYIGDDGTLSDGEKYIFIDSKTAGSAHALKASDLPLNNAAGKRGTAVSVTITTTAEGTLITTINTNLEFTYASTGTKLVISGSNYLYVNGNGVGYKESSSRSTYGTHTLYGWTDKSSNRYVYYDSSNDYFTVSEDSKNMYAFKKQTPEYSNYVTECDANIVKVTYDANGGATTCAGGSHDKTTDYTVCSTPPTRDYYTFAGWLCSADSKTYAANATISAAAIDADFTLTAQWTPVPYTITYNYNGGSAQVDPVPATSYTVESSAITLQTPTKGHDRFDGWYENADLSTGGVKTTIAAGSHENKTYYAKWTARHEIVFDADGATTTIYRADDEALNASVAGQGSIPANPSAPSACSSKEFVGWVAEEIDGETDDEPTFLDVTSKVNADKHYYAVWATSVGTPIDAVEDNSFTGSGCENYMSSSYGMKEAGDYIIKNSIWTSSNMTDVKVRIRVKHVSNNGAETLRVSLVNSSDVEVDGADLITTAFGTNSTPAAYSSYVELTPTSSVTGYKVAVKTKGKSVYGTSVYAVTREVVPTRSAYSTSCCATKVTLSDPSITGTGATITFDKVSPVWTCGDSKTVTATVTVTTGYQVTELSFSGGSVSVSPTISTPITSTTNYTLTFAEGTNATLTTTATAGAKPLNSITITPSSGEVYVGQYVDFTVSYDPADYLSKGYTLNATPVYVTKESAAPANTMLRLKGGRGSGPGASITETVNETVTIKASGDNTKTASVNMTVNPLPRIHFEDLVHGKSFDDVVATIVENALSATKTTPTSDDWTTPNANECEENHLHLVGWIREDWPALVTYLNGGAQPSTSDITSAGNDGSGNAYFLEPEASINTQTFNGVTFYAVWAKIE